MTTRLQRAVPWLAAVLACAPQAAAQARVATTLHNLSVSGPGEIRALSETEVCKFCHVPHNAVVPVPLWGHAMSSVERYQVPTLQRGRSGARPAPQPDGSSRLCLSCHDGTVALGDLGQGGPPLRMGGAARLGSERRGYLGTDLSGSHPISFVVRAEPPGAARDTDVRIRPQPDSADEDLLDGEGKMQCTTCHDPHSDQYYDPGRVPRFWARPTVDEICLACHELR